MNYKLPLQICALSSLMVTITPTMVLPTNPSNTHHYALETVRQP